MRKLQHLVAFGMAVLLAASPLLAQEEEEHAPEPAKGVRITFLPPPIPGSITLGLFDRAGKLVRVLKREAKATDFTVGLNGLIVQWDGSNDEGALAPVGKYQARGYSVGAVNVEGEAFHGNDWITSEESLRLMRVVHLALDGKGELFLKAMPPGAMALTGFRYDAEKDQLTKIEDDAGFPEGEFQVLPPGEDVQQAAAAGAPERWLLQGGSLWRVSGGKAVAVQYPELRQVVSAASGRESTLWVIDEDEEAGRIVKQFSASGELLRALPTEPSEPLPAQIVADPAKDAIHLLEISPQVNRVRSLVLERQEEAPKGEPKAVSTWRTVLSKSIRNSNEYSEEAASAGRAEPFKAEAKINVRLVPNPLFRNQPASVNVQIVTTPQGSLLQTTDGLPLKQLTETPGLRWVAMAREAGTKAIVMLQSDGAVVEEYRIRRLGQMMAFDAGEYELTR